MEKKAFNLETILKVLFTCFLIYLCFYDYNVYIHNYTGNNYHSDFSLYYESGIRFTKGESLYQQSYQVDKPLDQVYKNPMLKDLGNYYLYPPLLAFIISFLTKIQYDNLYRIFISFNFILLLIVSYFLKELVWKKYNKDWLIVIGFWILLISSIACKDGQFAGQIDIVVLATIVGSIFFENKNKHFLAGICLAIACYIKISPAVLILPLIKFKKWSMLKSFFVSSIVITISIIIASPQGWYIFKDFFQYLSIHTYEIQTHKISIGFSYEIAKAIGSVTPNTLLIVKFFVILFFFTLTFRFKWNKDDDFIILYSIFIFAMLCISPIVWVHHFIWLSFPFAVYGSTLLERKKYFSFFIAYLIALTPIQFANFINIPSRALLPL